MRERVSEWLDFSKAFERFLRTRQREYTERWHLCNCPSVWDTTGLLALPLAVKDLCLGVSGCMLNVAFRAELAPRPRVAEIGDPFKWAVTQKRVLGEEWKTGRLMGVGGWCTWSGQPGSPRHLWKGD